MDRQSIATAATLAANAVSFPAFSDQYGEFTYVPVRTTDPKLRLFVQRFMKWVPQRGYAIIEDDPERIDLAFEDPAEATLFINTYGDYSAVERP